MGEAAPEGVFLGLELDTTAAGTNLTSATGTDLAIMTGSETLPGVSRMPPGVVGGGHVVDPGHGGVGGVGNF